MGRNLHIVIHLYRLSSVAQTKRRTIPAQNQLPFHIEQYHEYFVAISLALRTNHFVCDTQCLYY